MLTVALIQESPIFLNKEASLNRAVEFIADAASQGAKLILFPETFIPGYPAWIWRLRPGADWGICDELHYRLWKNSVSLAKGDLEPIKQAAKQYEATVLIGVNERDSFNSETTLFNSLIMISDKGEIINHHRKLMPTNPERMVWGMGDASGLNVVDVNGYKVGGLICWENYMPLARYALYAQGVEIYVAPTYDSGDGWLGSMQHIAREGKCWVLCCGVAIQRQDLPVDLPNLDTLYPEAEDWINPGDSVIIAPGGEVIAGPLRKEKDILIAEIDVEKHAIAKRALDVTGHYSRPDIFTLHVDKSAHCVLECKENKKQ